ncbi:MAG: hypothetical protein CMF74_13710 [Maricaulis sp.]|nr:hypothetical protein [Maricaulis sp.]
MHLVATGLITLITLQFKITQLTQATLDTQDLTAIHIFLRQIFQVFKYLKLNLLHFTGIFKL